MQKLLSKILAAFTALSMLSGYFSVIGVCGSKVIAMTLDNQSITTNDSNVEFDVYFKEEKNITEEGTMYVNNTQESDIQGDNVQTTKTHEITRNIQSEQNSIFVLVNVTGSGYLKDGRIEFRDATNNEKDANFKINEQNTNNNQSTIQGVENIEASIVNLSKITKGSKKEIELPIIFNANEKIDVNSFNQENAAKLTATYVNENGKETSIESTINIKLNWHEEANTILTQEIVKYIPYNIKQAKGIILQTLVKSGVENSKLPIKNTLIEIQAPQINNTNPTTVKVSANTMVATNGKINGIDFTNENYNYSQETQKVTIQTQNNADQNGDIFWKKGVQDEYVVTYIYPQETIESVTGKEVSIQSTAKSTLNLYNNVETKIEKEVKLEQILNEKLNDIVELQTYATAELSKGFIYSNLQSDEEYMQETTYIEQYSMNISYADVVTKINLKMQEDKYLNERNQEYAAKSLYQKITINKEEYLKLLGETATIYILSEEGATYATINKDTQADENGYVQIDLTEYESNKIEIEISKPEIEGNLNIFATKAIKQEYNYTKSQIQTFKKIKASVQIIASYQSENILDITQNAVTNLKETYGKIDLELDKQVVSTTNETTQIQAKVILDTSNVNYALYENPIIDIVLPQEFKKISVSDITKAFDEELEIEKYEQMNNTIRIYLIGNQTKYAIGAMSRGINIIVNLNVETQELLPDKQVEIKAYVQNHEQISYENVEGNRGVTSQVIKLSSPVGLVAVTQVLNASKNDPEAMVVEDIQTFSLDINAGTKDVTIKNIILNNYQNELTNVKILGRTIFAGKQAEGQIEEESTIDAPMNGPIAVEGITTEALTIYYSENEFATTDLTDEENAWTTTPVRFQDVKSYMVIFNTNLPAGTKVSLVYTTQLAANLQYGEYTYVNYDVYYVNPVQSSTEEKLTSGTVTLTTGEGPVLNIEASLDTTEDIQEEQIVVYTVEIKNSGTTAATGVLVDVAIPDGMIYMKEVNGTYTESYKSVVSKIVGDIKAGETKNIDIAMKADVLEKIQEMYEHSSTTGDIKEYPIKIYSTVSCYEALDGVKTPELDSKIVLGYLTTSLSTETSTRLKEGDQIEYFIQIKNINQYVKKDLTIVDVIPEGLEYVSASYKQFFEAGYTIETKGISYDEKTRTLTFKNVEDLGAYKNFYGTIILKVSKKDEQGTVSNYITTKFKTEEGEEKQVQSNSVTNNYLNDLKLLYNFETNLTSDVPENATLYKGDSVTLVYTLKNTSTTAINNYDLTINIPEEMNYISSKYEIDGVVSETGGTISDNTINSTLTIYKNHSIKYTLTLTAKELTSQQSIYPSFDVKMKNPSDKNDVIKREIKGVSYIVAEKNVNSNDNNEDDNDDNNSYTYRILGTAWKDKNENGIKEDNEDKMSGINVLLLNNKTGDLIRNNNGKIIKVTTNEAGYYEFTNIPNGDYTVIFLYDSGYYTTTNYRKQGVDTTQNSDAIETKIILDGTQILAGVTETIEIENQNLYNIDLGLIDKERFDLKLEKYVESIIVQNQTGSATYEQREEELVKRELTGKYINNTNLIIRYKIKVTNEGSIGGFAKKIVDYIPKELTFNSELNSNWYIGENNNAYTSKFANEEIKPGETKETTLILTKTMSENSLGTILNTAEIFESYSTDGQQDIDSTTANKAENEDDLGTVSIILSIRTGEEILITGITIAIIAIIGAGIYFIRKRVIEK